MTAGSDGRAPRLGDLTPAEFQRVSDLVARAMVLGGAARDALLDEACAGEPVLRAHVEAVLSATDGDALPTSRGRHVMARAAARLVRDGADRAGDPLLDGTSRIGPYRIVSLLGEGGMGSVYEAEQVEPVKRRVALKVIRAGLGTRDVLTRFDAERQALSVMSHPCIARILDAGVSDDGRPWFAMELVEGTPLTRYCDEHELPTSERLAVFVDLCGAVQHAHQKGIIHRDLKPSNVLVAEVDGEPTPKVIDFGIAKAMSGTLTERTLVTRFGQALGTPAYMAPEQADETTLDVDTRADVYALGVMLFELLVGELPFEPEADWAGVLRDLVSGDRETPTPSRRLATLPGDTQAEIAKRRRSGPKELRAALRGDLDWIVRRAMEPTRERRYQSATDLADDIRRHASNQPVEARPPTFSYRASRYVRRHRVGVSVAATLALLLVAFAASMGVLWRQSEGNRLQAVENLGKSEENLERAVTAERDTRMEATTAEQVVGFLLRLFEGANPFRNSGREPTVSEMLDDGAERLMGGGLSDQPRVRARLLTSLGKINAQLGRFDQADSMLREALKLQREQGDELAVAETLEGLGAAAADRGALEDAHRALVEALGMRECLSGPDDDSVGIIRLNLGLIALRSDDLPGAKRQLQDALALLETRRPDAAAGARLNLAATLYHLGEWDEALRVSEAARIYEEAAHGPDSPSVASVLHVQALILDELGDDAATLELSRRVVAILDATIGPVHPQLADALNNLSFEETDPDVVVALRRRALDIRAAVFGDETEWPMRSRESLGWALQDRWEGVDSDAARSGLAEAEALHRRVLEWRERTQGDAHVRTWISRRSLANLIAHAGRLEEGIALLRDVLARHPRGEDFLHDYRETRDNLAWALRATGRPDEADAVLAERATAP